MSRPIRYLPCNHLVPPPTVWVVTANNNILLLATWMAPLMRWCTLFSLPHFLALVVDYFLLANATIILLRFACGIINLYRIQYLLYQAPGKAPTHITKPPPKLPFSFLNTQGTLQDSHQLGQSFKFGAQSASSRHFTNHLSQCLDTLRADLYTKESRLQGGDYWAGSWMRLWIKRFESLVHV